MKFILIPLFLSFNLTACAESNKYYCYFYPDKMVWHDDIILIEGKKPQRSIRELYERKERELYKAYDEGSKIVAVYYDRPYKNYKIIQLDLSSQPVTYFYGYGYHQTYKSFEKSYLVSFTDEALSQFNKNPELIKYLPEKPKDKDISHAFFKRKRNCAPLNLMEYYLKSMKLFLINLASAG